MSDELALDFSPFIKVYKDGRVERLLGTATVPASIDPQTGVQSKDVIISTAPLISVRLYIPKSTSTESTLKLPVLVYFHGGGFCIESAFSPTYHNYLNSFVSEANVIAVSVDYRLAPEHPVPAAYEDSWAAVKWVESHLAGTGPEEWLNRHADMNRVFFSGDSAGANIAHHMGLRVGSEKLACFKLKGIVLVHPYFWGEEPVGGELALAESVRKMVPDLWKFTYPLTCGSDDPLFNPGKHPKLGELGCEKVLVCVAEKDSLKDRGWYYSEVLKKSGWNGVVEVMEAKEEQHVFHLFNPSCDNAVAMLKKIVSFMN
ncbi:probable carboxylesterase 12 [Argentina anserina]|uniref:probable carboxylesterase 12 n=1 Tax=Argentina anserina TaxID=57926 RepID=UPI00217675F8|nr:probable carboxylesterase 12 [Potentilla anserina]